MASRADQDLGPAFIGLTVTLTVITLSTTAMRWIVRIANRALGWDDYTMTVPAVLTIGRLILQAFSVQYGNGRHVEFVTKPNYQTINRLGWATQIILFPSSALVKISICLLVLRIKSTPILRRCLIGVMIGVAIFNLVPLIVLLSECRPIQTYWNPSAGKCWSPKIRTYTIYVTIGYNIAIDLLCTALPIVAVHDLQMATKKKLLVSGLVTLGLLATGCAIGRAWSLSLNLKDMSWSYCIAAMWSNAELHVSIIASNVTCLPAFINFIRRLINPDAFNTTNHSGYNRSGYMHSGLDVPRPAFLNGKDEGNIQVSCRRTSSVYQTYPDRDEDTAIMITRRVDHKVMSHNARTESCELDSLPSTKS